jgi:soluble lytic murein transglycosylase
LTQIRPSTGRELGRKDGIRRFSTSMLYQPDVNLRLGTFYFRTLVNSLGGSLEAALAAYNAGKSRADQWLGWGPFREPAEFIETVPFTETREYIQSVLRNADFYRRLYAGRRASVSSVDIPVAEKKSSNAPARAKVRKSSGKAKRPSSVSKRSNRAFR